MADAPRDQVPHELDKLYNPKGLQEKWYPRWEEGGFFDFRKKGFAKQSDSTAKAKPYSIVIPPPNVTGSLHLGHALNHTLQDILTRFERMKGSKTLWVPGTDHAGIATQNVVERQLAAEGKKRSDMTREEFEKRVWQWKAESGGMITHQQRQLGESVNWSFERFTMDEGLSHIVKRVFVELYREGLIYRGERMINWCPKDQTALSNIEVEHREIQGNLYFVKYPLLNVKYEGESWLLVATTRPETILGDEALAIHPQDERYAHLKGAFAEVPFVKRKIPIIFDESVDKDFGTGVVKITPAHDFNDFETGVRHKLPFTNIMTDSAHMNDHAGVFKGLSREACRKAILEKLTESDMLDRTQPIKHSVGHSYRSGAIVEPRLSLQWFVKTKPLADNARDAVKNGETEFYPKRWENLFFDWMQKIEDWCISRQLWWGHRIPAWYCKQCDHVTVSVETATQCEACASREITQDVDVLDTWFSSALWPFSTLMPQDVAGIDRDWPEGQKIPGGEFLEQFYPTSTLVTGFDIIFFWVSRMMMMGLHFMKQVPFRKVMIHSLVRDANRQKMSKSKGNVVNPLEKMEEYGTDAFRFFLISIMPDGKDIVYDESRLKGYQAFCNKIYNTKRFIMMNQADYKRPQNPPPLSAIDHYIFSRLNETVVACSEALDGFHFSAYALAIYDFFWKTLCDHYIELTKISLKNEQTRLGSLYTLDIVFETALKLLHPVMPYLTEELYSYGERKGVDDLLIVSPWPEVAHERNSSIAAEIEGVSAVLSIVSKIRNIRAELSIEPGTKIRACLELRDSKLSEFLKHNLDYLIALGKLESIEFKKPASEMVHAVIDQVTIHLDLKDKIDIEKEKARIHKEIQNLEKGYAASSAKLNSDQFIDKAPKELVDEEKGKLETYETKIAALRQILSSLGK